MQQIPPYKPVKAFDARRVYDVWLRLVADEALYDAMVDGRHAEVATGMDMDAEDILILDDFAGQPGTKWHMDNLRHRCTVMVSRVLKWHLPATIALITGGNDDWLRDLTYEYISDQRWQDLGHHRRLAECARFAKVVRSKIMKRRRPPEYLDQVLSFELSTHELLQRAALLALEAWPKPVTGEIASRRPVHAPAVKLVELPVDIVGWLAKPEGPVVVALAEPTTALVWIPSPTEPHRMEALAAPAKALWDACLGDRTVAELAGSPADTALLARWLSAGALAA
ncbi:MAG: hypothetical protein ABI867_12685 [Kofleriaceae bacterium]